MYRNFCYVNNFKCVWALLLASFVLNLNTKKLYFKERIDEHLLVYLKSYNFMLRSILLPQRSVTFDIRTPVNSGKYMACVFYSVYLNNLFESRALLTHWQGVHILHAWKIKWSSFYSHRNNDLYYLYVTPYYKSKLMMDSL